MGRGYAASTVHGGRTFQPGRRRVVVKARFNRFKGGNIGAAKTHLRYIQRDGVTRDGEPGELYGPKTDNADGKAFLAEAKGDRHQFRFIVSPEDSAQFNDLKPFIRDLMLQVESDLGTKLDWVAVDHFNTGQPHTHIVVRGKDDRGQDLVIARDYLSHGLRERARDLATLELGPETRTELHRKLGQEVRVDRFTRIDHALIRDSVEGILTVPALPQSDSQTWSHRIGRLRKLETMGLAEELKPGVWKIAERTETVLCQLGRRSDIASTMQRALRKAAIDRPVSDHRIFAAENLGARVTGKIIAMGLSNELLDEHYVILDGTDGKLHYAEIGKRSRFDPPETGMVVTVRGQKPEQTQRRFSSGRARLFIESHTSFEGLATSDGATWLDRKMLETGRKPYPDKGFGAQANRALRQRQQWLVRQGLMTRRNGKLIASRNMLRTLRNREVNRVGQQMQQQLSLTFQPVGEGEKPRRNIAKSIKLASGRFAIVQMGKQFSLVPWKHAKSLKRTDGIAR